MPLESPPYLLRIALVVTGLAIWFFTQWLIKWRPTGEGVIGDGLHSLSAPLLRYLTARPRLADALLVLSSLGIDCLGGFVLWQCIVGPSIRPFLGIAMLFTLRQLLQAVCALPPPQGMIWRSPGVPSLLVTYGVANDLFFSGHTAMAVFGAIELGRLGGPTWAAIGVAIGVFEIATVIVLRAHYTMDVYAGAVTALVAVWASNHFAPAVDLWLATLR